MKIKRGGSTKEGFYRKERTYYTDKYWKDNENNLFRPNGFIGLPDINYGAFREQINKDGKVLDLGCGNGLMLKYLMATSGFKLIPYGADFMEKSIKQAKEILFPEYADNFDLCNVADYTFEKGPFDFIFTFISHVHTSQRKKYIGNVVKSCKKGGRIIFYEYRDVIEASKIQCVGDSPELKNIKTERRNYPTVSFAILDKR